MPAKRSAVAAVAAALSESMRRKPARSWFDRLPKEAQEDFAEIKKKFVAGEYHGANLSAIHRGIVARCKEESWPAPIDACTVRRWLYQQ